MVLNTLCDIDRNATQRNGCVKSERSSRTRYVPNVLQRANIVERSTINSNLDARSRLVNKLDTFDTRHVRGMIASEAKHRQSHCGSVPKNQNHVSRGDRMKRPLFALLTLATFSCSACGGGGGGGTGPAMSALPAVTFSHSFPSGDATAASGTAWDIVGVATTIETQPGISGLTKYDYLRVDVTFAQNVQNALPAPGSPLANGSQLGLRVSIDTDANVSTGTFGGCIVDATTPFEYSTDQGNGPSRLLDGNYSILGPGGKTIYSGPPNPVDEAITTATGNIISVGFYLPTIGVGTSTTVPKLGIAIAAFNASVSTDCVPSSANLPEIFTDGS